MQMKISKIFQFKGGGSQKISLKAWLQRMVAQMFQLAKVRKRQVINGPYFTNDYNSTGNPLVYIKCGGGILGPTAVRHVRQVYKRETEFVKETAQKWMLKLLISRSAIKEAVSIFHLIRTAVTR